jgi:predicted nucleotidyltransferase
VPSTESRGWTFGSAARDDFDPESSDLDFLVEFEPMSPREYADSFFGLLEDLERLFGQRIDLLEPEPIENPYIRVRLRGLGRPFMKRPGPKSLSAVYTNRLPLARYPAWGVCKNTEVLSLML